LGRECDFHFYPFFKKYFVFGMLRKCLKNKSQTFLYQANYLESVG